MHAEIERLRGRMESPAPMKWVFCGDSITHGAKHTWGWRDYTELFSEHVRWEMGRCRDVVIKTGVSGWTAKELLNSVEWSALQFKPDVVSVMLGVNDARMGREGIPSFRSDILRIVDFLRDGGASVLLHTPNLTLMAPDDPRMALPLYVDELRSMAAGRDLPLVDHAAHWSSAFEERPERITAWMDDSLHPGHYGHVALAHLLLRELGLWRVNGDVCRMFVP